jgi:transposase
MSTTLAQVCLMLAVAVEISAAKWLVASWAGGANKGRQKSLTQATPEARLEALIAELSEALKRFGLAPGTRVVVAYEAGQEGFWLLRALRARGIEAEVIHPNSLRVDRRARRAKTDRLDARALVVSLWQYFHGDTDALRFVHAPSVQAEDEREWQRERDRLESERRSCQDRIGKKLRTHGIWAKTGAWREALRDGSLQTIAGRPLEPMLLRMLQIELARLEAAEAHLRELAGCWKQTLAPETLERIDHLHNVVSIGPVTARRMALQFIWRDFKNGRQVGACLGLVGVPYDSGVSSRDQGISHEGDGSMRAAAIELSWLWVRHQPNSTITRWFRERTQGAGARGKKVMIVAVARRLMIALWRYFKFGEVPVGARLRDVAAAA